MDRFAYDDDDDDDDGDGGQVIHIFVVQAQVMPTSMGQWTDQIKAAHIQLVAWLWLEIIPKVLEFPEALAWDIWGRFREDPTSERPDVAGMRAISRSAWDHYISLN